MSSGSFEIEMQAISMSGGVSSILWAGAGILGTDAVDELVMIQYAFGIVFLIADMRYHV